MKNLMIAIVVALMVPFSVFAAEVDSSVDQEQVIDYANINLDDAERLATLMTGVGPTIAERIVAYREQNGDFNSVDDLLQVKGIGSKTLEKNLHLLKI